MEFKRAKASGRLIVDFLWTNVKWHFFASILAILLTGLLFLMTASQGCDGGSCAIVFMALIPVFLVLFMARFAYACGRMASLGGTWVDLLLGILSYATLLFALIRILELIDRETYEILVELNSSWLPGFIEAAYVAIAVSGFSTFILQSCGKEAGLARRATICVSTVLAILIVFWGVLDQFIYAV
jgi:hypothetical protein